MCEQSATPFPSDVSPVMAIYRLWRAAYAALNTLQDDEDAADLPHTYQSGDCRRLEAQMMALPSRDARDLAAKLMALSHFGDFCLDRVSAKAIFAESYMLAEGTE